MKNRLTLLLLPLLLVLFALGLARLFQLRLEQGDIYPPYSTLRADPLGAKVYFESLGQLPALNVSRLYEDTDKFGDGRDTTLFVLGTDVEALRFMPEHELKDVEKFMQQGGRVVISLFPTAGQTWMSHRREGRAQAKADKEPAKQPKRKAKPPDAKDGDQKSDAKEKVKPDQPGDAKKELPDAKSAKRKRSSPGRDDEEEMEFKSASLYEHWGVSIDYIALGKSEKDTPEPATVTRADAASALPASLSWHTALVFTNVAAEWRTNYARDGRPVLIERRVGKGSLVLSADSYFVSNEALRRERHAALLAWLVGPSHRLLFDETHLGVQSDLGIAVLARRYRLHGLAVGLFLLTLLFVWKNATSFVPPHDDDSLAGRAHAVAGRDSAEAFVNLLRRSIPAKDLLTTCFDEWRKSGGQHRPGLDARVKRMQAVVAEQISRPAKDRDAAGGYRELGKILAERK